jgi:hypothetical protein
MSQPICVFPQGITLNISLSREYEAKKADLNSDKVAIKMDGYVSVEKDYDDYYDSYEVVAYPELAVVDAFDNKLVHINVDSNTPEALQYFIIAGTKGNLYIKDYTLEVNEEAKTATLKFHELHQGNPIEVDPNEVEEVSRHFTANPSYSSLSNMEPWKKYPYRSTALMFHPEEGEIVYLIDLDGGRETYGKGARMVAKVDGDPERVKRAGRRFKRDFYAKARESAQYVNVEGDTITIDVSLTVPKA